jgi:hypothetical protein
MINIRCNLIASLPTALLFLYCNTALAFEQIRFSDGTVLDISLQVNYQNLKRMNGVDPTYTDMRINTLKISSIVNTLKTEIIPWKNMNDGDNSIKKHGTISNRVSALTEINLAKDDYRAFLRANTFHDAVFYGNSGNDSQGTFNGIGPSSQYTPEAKSLLGQRTRLLDAYVQGRWKLGENGTDPLLVRVGRQVVNWGEGLLFMGIGGSMNPMDMVKGLTPGVPIQELFLPTEQVYATFGATENLTLMAYKKWKFRETEVAPVGTFFSPSDTVGPGAAFLSAANLGPLGNYGAARAADIGRTASGQWGLGGKYQLTEATGIGLYHLRYTDMNPLPEFSFGGNYWILNKGPVSPATDPIAGVLAWTNLLPSSFATHYMNEVKLTGASFTTRVGDMNVAGEVAYRDGAPLLMADQHYALARGKVTNAQLSAIKIWGHEFLFDLLKADQITLAAEVATSHVNSFATPAISGSLDYPAILGLPKGTPALMYDRNAGAYALNLELAYNAIFPGWDMKVPMMWMQELHGNPALQGWNSGLGGKQDRHLSLGVKFTYMQNLELGAQLAYYLGSLNVEASTFRPWADRDFIAFTAAYHF